MDVDIFAGFHHLLARLGEARLVAVDGRNLKKPRQEDHERKGGEKGHRASVRNLHGVEESGPSSRRVRTLRSGTGRCHKCSRLQAARTIEKSRGRGKVGGRRYCTRTMTLSAAPLASVTVSRR